MHTFQWLLLLMLVWSSTLNFVMPESKVPCLFIFGDSLVDNGNNNNINSLAKANYPPYGIDFAKGPTGRFSNGLTTVDVIGIYQPFSLSNPKLQANRSNVHTIYSISYIYIELYNINSFASNVKQYPIFLFMLSFMHDFMVHTLTR